MIDISPSAQQLKEQLSYPLPGKEAHHDLAPHYADKYADIPKVHKTAAVLITLYPKDNNWQIIFMKRSNHEADTKHAGQISFPGGQLEKNDRSLEDCALRENEEEIGVLQNNIEILGKLTPIYVFASNFVVHPFLAVMDHEPKFILNKSEVAKVITVPLPHLIKSTTRKVRDIKVGAHLLKDINYFDVQDEILWGATAIMTNELIFIYRKLQSDKNI